MRRLVTRLDISPGADQHVQIDARHELQLDAARSILLLSDRGWGLSGCSWPKLTVEEIETDARVVVGPDEPFGDRSEQDMWRDHWADLADVAARQHVAITAADLSRLPHDVILSPRLLERLRSQA